MHGKRAYKQRPRYFSLQPPLCFLFCIYNFLQVSLTLDVESKRTATILVEGYRTDENQPLFIEYFNRFVWALETLTAEQYGGIDVRTTVSVDGGQEFDISELREAAATGKHKNA